MGIAQQYYQAVIAFAQHILQHLIFFTLAFDVSRMHLLGNYWTFLRLAKTTKFHKT